MGSSDPFLQTLKHLNYNVVRLPRVNIRPLQILEKRGNDLVIIGDVPDLFIPGDKPLPEVTPDQPSIDLSGSRSRELELSVGLTLLGGILGAMTGSNLKLNAGFKNAKSVVFEFDNVLATTLDKQINLMKFIAAARIDESAPPAARLAKNSQIFIITDTIKSRKFTVEAFKSGGVEADVDVPVIKSVASGTGKVTVKGESKAKVSFEGEAPLVFGFKAVRVEFENGKLKNFVDVESGSVGLRKVGGDDEPGAETPEPELEMLSTPGPFANLLTAGEAERRAQGSAKKKAAAGGGAKKAAVKKVAAKKAAAKKAAAKATGAKAAKKGAVKKAAAKKAAVKATKKAAKPPAKKAAKAAARKPAAKKSVKKAAKKAATKPTKKAAKKAAKKAPGRRG
jgi:hypothetical protein